MTARREGPDAFRKFSMTTWSLGRTASVSMLPWTSVRNAGDGESLWTFGIRCHRGVFKEASFRLEVLSVPWREHWARACGERTVRNFSIVDLGRHLT